jgi:hypothetical protein
MSQTFNQSIIVQTCDLAFSGTGIAIGVGANLTTGNTNIGSGAGAAITTGSNNVLIAPSAGSAIVGGSSNIVVGAGAGAALVSGSGCIIVGNGANVDTAGRSNAIVIGNGITSTASPPNPHDGGLYMQHFSGSVTGIAAVWAGNELVEASSSIRYKENIRALEGESKVDLLHPVRYNGIGDASHREQIGLLAEEVESIYPEFVVYKDFGDGVPKPNGLAYDRMVAILIYELQQQRLTIANMQLQIDALKK